MVLDCLLRLVTLMWRTLLQAAGDFSSAVILPVDTEDVGDAYNFIADVPGLEKGDIKVSTPADTTEHGRYAVV